MWSERIEKTVLAPIALASVFFLLAAINTAATRTWGWTTTETFLAYVVSVGSVIWMTAVLTRQTIERANGRDED